MLIVFFALFNDRTSEIYYSEEYYYTCGLLLAVKNATTLLYYRTISQGVFAYYFSILLASLKKNCCIFTLAHMTHFMLFLSCFNFFISGLERWFPGTLTTILHQCHVRMWSWVQLGHPSILLYCSAPFTKSGKSICKIFLISKSGTTYN